MQTSAEPGRHRGPAAQQVAEILFTGAKGSKPHPPQAQEVDVGRLLRKQEGEGGALAAHARCPPAAVHKGVRLLGRIKLQGRPGSFNHAERRLTALASYKAAMLLKPADTDRGELQ